jgi:hypothetical protein
LARHNNTPEGKGKHKMPLLSPAIRPGGARAKNTLADIRYNKNYILLNKHSKVNNKIFLLFIDG